MKARPIEIAEASRHGAPVAPRERGGYWHTSIAVQHQGGHSRRRSPIGTHTRWKCSPPTVTRPLAKTKHHKTKGR